MKLFCLGRIIEPSPGEAVYPPPRPYPLIYHIGSASNAKHLVSRAQPAPDELLGETLMTALDGLARVFHERGRLALCTVLVGYRSGISFCRLRDTCGLTGALLAASRALC